MSATGKTLSIAIEGFGDPSTAKPYRLRAQHRGTVSSSVLPALLLVSWPDVVSQQADPIEGWAIQSSIAFEVVADYLDAAVELRRWAWQSAPEWVGYLSQDLSAVGTTARVELRGGETVPADNSLIFVEREVMLVTASSVVSGSTYDLTVTRGLFGTDAVAHSSAITSDRAVYTVNPIVPTRAVTLYDYDMSADTETAIGAGLLEEPSFGEGSTVVRFSARDALLYLQKKMIGEGRLQWPGIILDAYESTGVEALAGRATIKQEPERWAGSDNDLVLGIQQSDGVGTVNSKRVVVWQGDAVVPAQVSEYFRGDRRYYKLWSSPVQSDNGLAYETLFGTKGEDKADGQGVIRECLIIDADSDYGYGHDEDANKSDHPLDALLSFWTSTGTAQSIAGSGFSVGDNGAHDYWPDYWACGVPASLVDISGIRALRDNWLFRGLRARNFILGKEDELQEAKAVTQRLLKPLFAFPVVATDGKLSISAIYDPGPSGVSLTITDSDLDAAGIPEQPWSSIGRRPRIKVQAARIGISGEFGEEFENTDIEGLVRNRYPYGSSTIEIDAGDYGDPETHRLDINQKWILAAINRWRHLVLRERLSEYLLILRPDLDQVRPGDVINLSSNFLVGPDGNRGFSEHRCFVLEAFREVETRVQQIRVLDLYPMARGTKLLAPCWRIASVTSDTVFDIEGSEFTDDDTATWVDGAEVELYTRRGVKRSTGGAAKGNISGDTITLADAWEDGGGAITPSAGDIIRLPDYDDAQADWSDYAFIADTDATLGVGGDEPHRWSL